jgi:hypothetical protein
MAGVLIRGQGVGAYGCAHLLAAAGISVTVEETERPRLPAILLGEATQGLIRDVFGQNDLFRGLPRVERRVVEWGPNASLVTLPHSAVVISEEELSKRLRPAFLDDDQPPGRESPWTILAARPLPSSSVEHHFGTRRATALAVTLKDESDSAACWIESLENGWLFLIPAEAGSGWLLAVGAPPLDLLAKSRLIAEQIQTCDQAGAEFPAYPRIADPLCSRGWLSCGTAALAFDPLCGAGAGNAVREAILAAAVIRAAAKGGDPDDLLAHYDARLTAGFQRHLELCRGFYVTGGTSDWWQTELDFVHNGIEWCTGKLSAGRGFRYQLMGFELQPLP